jgi:hypothetical protein
VRNWWFYELFGPTAALLLLFVVVAFVRRPDVSVERDSDEFSNALSIWADFLTMRYPSPREVKRFVNYVRYLAMRGRNNPPELSPLERSINSVAAVLYHYLAANKPISWQIAQLTSYTPNPATIVCMALIAYRDSKRDDYGQDSTTASDPLLTVALKEHQRVFKSLPTPKDWEWFDGIAGEVRIHTVSPVKSESEPIPTSDQTHNEGGLGTAPLPPPAK